MACNCNTCVRDKTAKDQIVLLSPEQQLYWATIYNDLLYAEDELSRAMAIIDGSRPDEKKPLDIEPLAEAVHGAYIFSLLKAGLSVESECAYDQLDETSKECDRATVRAVLAALVKKS